MPPLASSSAHRNANNTWLSGLGCRGEDILYVKTLVLCLEHDKELTLGSYNSSSFQKARDVQVQNCSRCLQQTPQIQAKPRVTEEVLAFNSRRLSRGAHSSPSLVAENLLIPDTFTLRPTDKSSPKESGPSLRQD